MSFPLDTIVARAKRRGFVYPGSDIYGGLANARDYGPYGIQLKKNIQDLRWKTFVQQRPDMVGLDAQILMHPKVWEASGHVGNFNDPMIDDKKTGHRFRADKLIEECLYILREGFLSNQNANRLTRRYNFPENFILEHNNLIKESKIEEIQTNKTLKEVSIQLNKNNDESVLLNLLRNTTNTEIRNFTPESRTFEEMRQFIQKFIPNNPETNKPADWTDVRKFNMMFHTYQGVIHDDESKVRLRPETAQGIFVNLKNILDTTRSRIPFGIAQLGKAFRNEITPGNFLYRTREFEQMEIEYFIEADETQAMKHFDKRLDASKDRWLQKLGMKTDNIRFREHEAGELAHYSSKTTDVEYNYPRGRGELQGLAYRGDYDLKQHQEHSGKDMQYQDPYTNKKYLPHVIEPSFGLSRTVLAVMLDAYDEHTYTDQNGKEATRTVCRLHKNIAPVKFAILPLVKKDEKMVALSHEIFAKLSENYVCEYDDGGAIGKRYRRQDEIGTPYCLTIDHQSLEDGTVTIRDRDTMEQQRIKIEKISL